MVRATKLLGGRVPTDHVYTLNLAIVATLRTPPVRGGGGGPSSARGMAPALRGGLPARGHAASRSLSFIIVPRRATVKGDQDGAAKRVASRMHVA